ncbi:MAG: hypothetical protein ACF8SC_09430 [Phycisphaerales bacterium JB037]
MSRWNLRSVFGRSEDSLAKRHAKRLREEAGHAATVEMLEPRVLLAGDHPSLVDFPNATDINLNVDGRGVETGEIELFPGNVLDDGDLFRFTAPATDFVRILADAQNAGSDLDTKLEIYEESGGGLTLIGESSGNSVLTAGTPTDAWFGFLATAGNDYYIRVLGDSQDPMDPESIGEYIVRVNTRSQDLVYDDNTGLIGFTPIDPTNGPAPIDLTLGGDDLSTPAPNDEFSQDDVVLKFVIPDDEVFDGLLGIAAGADAADLDTRLDIYDGNGELIPLASDSQSSFLTSAFTTLRTTPGETYYIRVRSDEFGDPGVVPSAGQTTVRVKPTNNEVVLDRVNRQGINSDVFAADAFDFGLFRFTNVTDGLTFITGVSGANPFDIRLTLFNSDGDQIAFSDDFINANAEIQQVLEGDEEYFILFDSVDDPLVNIPVDPLILVVEAAHTYNQADDILTDDHENTPDGALSLDEIRRRFEDATPLVFNQPQVFTDADGNIVRDKGHVATAVGSGRIFTGGDSDLFQFTAPMDLLGNYAGNNDDAGTSLFFGGRFTGATQNDPFFVGSRGLALYDAADFWAVGDQREEPITMTTLGIVDNPATPGTDVGEVYALQEITINGAPALVVGGDFLLNVPTGIPANPVVTFQNLAVWSYNALAGRYVWGSLGDADGPVRAMTVFNPEDSMDLMLDDPGEDQLVLGGEFTNIGGAPFQNLAMLDLESLTWGGLAAPAVPGPVYALAVYDPADPGEGRAADMDAGLDEVDDPADYPTSLIIGGDFNAGPGITNVALWVGQGPLEALSLGEFRSAPTSGTNGPVYALTVFDPPDVGDNPDGPLVAIGGDFTTIGGLASPGVGLWGRVSDQDPEDPQYEPKLEYVELGGGVDDGPVYALGAYTLPELDTADAGGLLALPGGPAEGEQVLFIGGDFSTVDGGGLEANNAVMWDGTGFSVGGDPALLDFDAPVRTIHIGQDAQEPLIDSRDDAPDNRDVVYFGGEFTGHLALFDVQLVDPFLPFYALEALAAGFDNTPGGPDDTVFALTSFDDQNPAFDNSGQFFDRHDKPSARPQIVVSPATGSFVNSFITVYDSNFQVIYTNDTISPPFPDPSGAIDPSRPGVADSPDANFILPPIWGGETYYIEVTTLAGTGRYNLSVSIDAVPDEMDGDGVTTSVNWTDVENSDPDVFGFNAPRNRIVTSAGDANNEFDLSPPGLQGDQIKIYEINPSTRSAIGEEGSLGLISNINDSDLYAFTAANTGTVEIRLSTTALADAFQDTNGVVRSKTYNSMLDGAIRVFNNDLEQIGYARDGLVNGDRDQLTFTGTYPAAAQIAQLIYTDRDPRLVLPVVEGERYFISIESAQRYKDGSPADPDDRVENIPEEIDWRHALGSYLLLINSPNTDTALVPGDDHVNGTLGQGTVIPLDSSGQSFLNLFRNDAGTPLNPNDDFFYDGTIESTTDADLFELIAPASGFMTIRVERAQLSPNLLPQVTIFEIDPDNPTQTIIRDSGTSTSEGFVELTFPVTKGEVLFPLIDGGTVTTGQYRISVTSPDPTDDHADIRDFANATPLKILDFLGSASASGEIEENGDTDVFRFIPSDTLSLEFTVAPTAGAFDARLTIYEVQEDLVGNPYLTRIGETTVDSQGGPGARVTVPVNINRVSSATMNEYPTYYLVVEGTNPENGTGAYTLSASFDPTDDHADRSEFDVPADRDLATFIVVENTTGLGSAQGEIEFDTDSDFFTFIAPAGGEMGLSVSNLVGSTLDALVSVYDSSGNLITDNSGGAPPVLFFNVTRGDGYFVIVEPDPAATDPDTTGGYSLAIDGPANDDHANETEFGLATIVPLNPNTGDASVGTGVLGGNNPLISPSKDTDLFRFTTLAEGPTSITVTPLGGALTLRPEVTVYDSNFNVVATASTASFNDPVTIDLGTTGEDETYFVLVADIIRSAPPGSEYTLVINSEAGVTDPPDDPSAVDFANPTPINLNFLGNADVTDQINVANDRDLFRFVAPSSGQVFVQVVTPQGSLLDASVAIYNQPSEDPSGRVAQDSGGILGVTANTSFEAVGGQEYFVLVDGIGAATGSYTVRIDAVAGAVSTQIPEVDSLGFTHRLFYPEGFSSNQVREFVSIANPNNFAVNYSLILRYETGARDAVVVNNATLAAGSRGGVTLSEGGAFATGVRPNAPYAIEIVSSAPLGATLSHYDFDIGTGEAFTSQISDEWTFGRVQRDTGVRDFILFQNPQNFAINVTLRSETPGGQVFQITRQVNALRRGGFDISALPNLPVGIFGVTLTATPVNPANQANFDGIVAALTHFDTNTDGGYGLLGDATGGTTAGTINNLTRGPGSNPEIVIYNPNDAAATVDLSGSYIRADLPGLARRIQVPGNGIVRLSGSDLGLINNQPIGIAYTSDLGVSVVFGEDRGSDSNGQGANTFVGTNWFFGDAYIRRPLAGESYFETLSFFNPAPFATEVQIDLLYANGNADTITIQIDAFDFGEFVIHDSETFLNNPLVNGVREKTAAFSIQATSSSPISASLTHFDLVLGSGWGMNGANLGLINPLSSVI